MGAVSSTKDTLKKQNEDSDFNETSKQSRSNKELRFLIGRLEQLPHNAQKLFELSKLYLTPHQENDHSQTLPYPLVSSTSGNENTKSTQLGSTNLQFSPFEAFSACLFTPKKPIHSLQSVQTFIQWKATFDVQQFVYICSPTKNTIYIQPLDQFPDFISIFSLHMSRMTLDFFQMIQAFCQIYFLGLEVALCPPLATDGWNVKARTNSLSGQQQLCVNDLFPLLRSRVPSNGIGVVGFTWSDLYPEGFNFVLGEASFEHKSAVVSFGKYDSSRNIENLTHVDAQLIWTIFKSISHEICHLMGLKHCEFFSCAMNESETISQAMSQPLVLCPVCLRKVHHYCEFDILERYIKLRDFLLVVTNELDEDFLKLNETIQWLNNCINFLTNI